MPITSSNFAKALWPGVNAWYGQSYNEYPVEWDKLFDKFTSDKQWEEDVGTSGFGLAVQKTEGAPISYDTERQAFITRYTHVVYALGFIITKEAYDDDQYGVVGKNKSQGLAFSVRQTKENVAANVYNRAFNSSYTGGDGVELLATNHPNLAGGTWQNELTTSADLSEAALEQACIDIANFTNDRGLRIAVMPQSLIIPVQLDFEANRILKSQYRVGTDLNDINVVGQRFPKGIVVNHYLTDSDAWFIRTNAPNGMKMFERWADAFDMDDDSDTFNAKYLAYSRYSFGWTDPRALYGSPGA